MSGHFGRTTEDRPSSRRVVSSRSRRSCFLRCDGLSEPASSTGPSAMARRVSERHREEQSARCGGLSVRALSRSDGPPGGPRPKVEPAQEWRARDSRGQKGFISLANGHERNDDDAMRLRRRV